MRLLICGFGAFFVVQLVKTLVWPHVVPSGLKLFLVLVTALISAILTGPLARTSASWALASAGAAVVIHKSTRLLSLLGDHWVKDALKRGRDSRRGIRG